MVFAGVVVSGLPPIDWTIRLTDEHWIRQLAIPGGHVDLLCEKRKGADAPANVSVSASAPIHVCIVCNGRSKILKITADRKYTVSV